MGLCIWNAISHADVIFLTLNYNKYPICWQADTPARPQSNASQYFWPFYESAHIAFAPAIHQCFRIGKIVDYRFFDIRNMQKTRLLFQFCKCYDLITIGPYANKVAQGVSKLSSCPVSILTIEEDNMQIEPCLAPFSSPRVALNQKNALWGDVELGVGVRQILPDKNQITLKNGSSYRYKYLVYSGNNSDWKDIDYFKNVQSRLFLGETFIYGDANYNRIGNMLNQILGTVVFVLPKGRHFGHENLLMMLMRERMRRRVQKYYDGKNEGQVIVLNQGESIVPLNEAHDSLVKEMMGRSGIRYYANEQLEFDYANQQAHLKSSSQTIKFNAVFHYFPLKVPEVLPLDPFQNDPATLNHLVYDNIYTLGNVFPTTHSISAINQMSKVMAINISNRIMGIRESAAYKGDTSFNMWVSESESVRIATNYDRTKLQSFYGQSTLAKKYIGLQAKYLLSPYVHRILNQPGAFNFNTVGMEVIKSKSPS